MASTPELRIVLDDATKNQKKADYTEDYKNAEQIEKSLDNASSSADKIKKSLVTAFNKSAIVGWAKIIKETVNGMVKAATAQAEYVENLNLMQVAFGDTAKEAENYVRSVANATGFEPSTITRQLGVFRQISDAMRYASDTADLLSTNLSKMSIDISSLYNVDVERAGKALESAITGQVRSIRSLTGADITQATLQQDALAMGINKTVTQMTRAEKTILIYLSLERQLANANGDAARTINSVANQTKIFKDQIALAGRQIGAVFIPILKTLLPILNGILMAFNTIMELILGFFGIDASKMASEFGIASGGLDLIEDGLGGVTTASEKAKKSLRGFDKLNNITTPSASGSSGGGGVGGLGAVDNKLLEALKEYNLHLDEMKNKATAIRDRILEWLGFSKDVNGQWSWSAGKLLKNIWTWWSKLNGLAKIFVAIGAAVAVIKLYNAFKSLATLLSKTKIWSMISLIAETIGKKGLVGAIGELNSTFGALATFIEILIGIVAIVDGFIQFKNALVSIHEEGTNIRDITQALLGLLEVVSGLVLVFGTITGNAKAIAAGIAGIGLAFGGQFLLNVTDAKNKTQELYDQLNSEIWDNLAVYNRVQALSGELEKYIDANGRVQKSDEARVSYILNQLNNAYGTEYKLVDGQITQNGKLVKSYSEIQKEIDKYMSKVKAQMVLEKYQSVYSEALEKQEEKTQLVDRAASNYKETLSYIDDQEKLLIEKYGDEAKAHAEAENARRIAGDEYKKQLEDINKKYKDYEKMVGNYELLQEASFKNDIQMMNMLTKEIIGDQVKVSDKAVSTVDSTSKNISKKVKSYFSDAFSVNDGYKFGADMGTGIQKGLNSKEYKIGIKGNITTSYAGVTQKADGGFLKQGELFIAREDGAEMVGTIGNHTAVANNDQIVQGISVGVAKAMMAVGKSQTSNVVIEATGDTSGLLNFINFEQRKRDRQYGL